MKRRGFLAALAAIPFLGRFAEAAPGGESFEVHNVDGSTPDVAVIDLYCPVGQVWIANGVMMLPVGLAKRLPRPTAVIGICGGTFKGWALR